MFQNMFNAEGSGRFIKNTAFVFTFHKDTDEEIQLRKNLREDHYAVGVQKMLKDIGIIVSDSEIKDRIFFIDNRIQKYFDENINLGGSVLE